MSDKHNFNPIINTDDSTQASDNIQTKSENKDVEIQLEEFVTKRVDLHIQALRLSLLEEVQKQINESKKHVFEILSIFVAAVTFTLGTVEIISGDNQNFFDRLLLVIAFGLVLIGFSFLLNKVILSNEKLKVKKRINNDKFFKRLLIGGSLLLAILILQKIKFFKFYNNFENKNLIIEVDLRKIQN